MADDFNPTATTTTTSSTAGASAGKTRRRRSVYHREQPKELDETGQTVSDLLANWRPASKARSGAVKAPAKKSGREKDSGEGGARERSRPKDSRKSRCEVLTQSDPEERQTCSQRPPRYRPGAVRGSQARAGRARHGSHQDNSSRIPIAASPRYAALMGAAAPAHADPRFAVARNVAVRRPSSRADLVAQQCGVIRLAP